MPTGDSLIVDLQWELEKLTRLEQVLYLKSRCFGGTCLKFFKGLQ